MAAAVRKETRASPNGRVEKPSAAWDWRVPAWRGDTDTATARAARERRTAWRRDHPAAWRGQLERLAHFEPAYRYDPAHEYTADWTTDPTTALPVCIAWTTTRTALCARHTTATRPF